MAEQSTPQGWGKWSQLVLASGNAGKLRELRALLEPRGLRVRAQSDWQVPEADEPFESFVENALAKARHASRYTGLPALADDSGLCVQALGGAPGVHSARYACEGPQSIRSDLENNRKLVEALSGVIDRAAWFVSVVVLVRSPDDPMPLIAQGVWHGQVLDEPRGDGGFGYDPYFLVPSFQLTAAQLSAEQKNQFSHRAQAVRRLLEQIDAVAA
jgi:XTP/dITP diphosphohydrolase